MSSHQILECKIFRPVSAREARGPWFSGPALPTGGQARFHLYYGYIQYYVLRHIFGKGVMRRDLEKWLPISGISSQNLLRRKLRYIPFNLCNVYFDWATSLLQLVSILLICKNLLRFRQKILGLWKKLASRSRFFLVASGFYLPIAI